MLSAILPVLLAANYAMSPWQFQETRTALVAHTANRFNTASEAAYAASLKYHVALASGEIGAKIYMDSDGLGQYYSYGPPMYSQVDPVLISDEIVYDTRQTDGHARVVGLWHEHALGSSWPDLYGHYEAIRETHQTVWTTLAHDFFVQYFDGTTVQPEWTSSVPAIQPLCTECD